MKENPKPNNQPEKVPGNLQFSATELVSLPPEVLEKMKREGWATLEEQGAYWERKERERSEPHMEELTCPQCEYTFSHVCRPPQRSEQEWTPEFLRKLMGHPNYDNAWAVCDAHNTALAAEQEKRADWNVVIEDLERELAAKRQRHEQQTTK
jgi:hypothetical protein